MMDDFAKGMFTAMSEFGQPFISESIWTEAALDIIARGGRTREGAQVYSEQDTAGDRNSKIFAHLVKAQMPFSLDQLKRLDQSIESVDVITKGKFDKYGQEFEFGDEFGGLFGFRAVNVNPGPIEPTEIVDAYINANRALFDVKKELKGDMDAARLLNISEESFYGSLDRISSREVNALEENVFTPYSVSNEVYNAFQENADKMGVANPYDSAVDVIAELESQFADLSLELPEFPVFANPLQPIMQDTPLGPTTLNLPSINNEVVSAQVQGSNFNNLTTQQKLDLLFGRG